MTTNKKTIDQILKAFHDHNDFVVACHVNPEGDALGSALGLAAFLEEQGKKVRTFCQDPVPRILNFLPGSERVISKTSEPGMPDALVVVDSSDLKRTGEEFPKFFDRFRREKSGPVINIDHHQTSDKFGDINLIRPDASSTCEMLYEIFRESGRKISATVATCLYTGLAHDTGSFRFPNTSPRTLEIAAELARAGADPSGICRNLYENQPRSKVELLSRVLETLRFSDDGRRAQMLLTDEMFRKTGTGPAEAEGFINIISAVEGVEVAILIREQAPDTYKVSFRSHDEVDVGKVAEGLGGGGHRQAAGATIQGDLESVRRSIHAALDKLLQKA